MVKWALRKVGVGEWIFSVVTAMYENCKSAVSIGGFTGGAFTVKVGVHPGSILSPLLFIIVMDQLSKVFNVGLPWELLFADDLALMASSL